MVLKKSGVPSPLFFRSSRQVPFFFLFLSRITFSIITLIREIKGFLIL